MTEKRPAHTAGRLEFYAKLTPSENHRGFGILRDFEPIGDVSPMDPDGVRGREVASRLVACWNACEGVADPEEAVRRWKRMEADERGKLDDTFALDALDACSPCSLVIEESGEARVTLWRDGEPLAFIGDNVREALAALGGMEVRGE